MILQKIGKPMNHNAYFRKCWIFKQFKLNVIVYVFEQIFVQEWNTETLNVREAGKKS